jgi:hypothetical protein
MNSDDVKRLRMWHEAASRAEELTPLTNREISDLLAAAEERDRLREQLISDRVSSSDELSKADHLAARLLAERDRALQAARELREALDAIERRADHEGPKLNDSVARSFARSIRMDAASASAKQAWLTDGGDNG